MMAVPKGNRLLEPANRTAMPPGSFVVALRLAAFALCICGLANGSDDIDRVTPRRPNSVAERDAWLDNMIGWHHYSAAEARLATGLSEDEIRAALKERGIAPRPWLQKPKQAPLRMLPYPGGRHPRIGFRNGAIDPQRETKISVFAPWADGGYVVVDVPEAIWSNLGLTYLAHTHVPTLWSKQNIALEPLEWRQPADNLLVCDRRLPNGIAFSTTATADADVVRFMMTLQNGTKAPLSDLRVQVCLMLKSLRGFEAQTKSNKRFVGDFALCHDPSKTRWIIAAFRPKHRTWSNPPCPCVHVDPRFPDCPPGDTTRVAGSLRFFEGVDVDAELRRIELLESLGGRTAPTR